MATTLSDIKREVRRLLSDLDETAYAQTTGDGVTMAFPLPDQNISADYNVGCLVNGVPTAGFTVDRDSGWVRFNTPPASGADIVWEYHYTQYNEADLLSAINDAVHNIWAEAPKTKLDTATIIAESNKSEYVLPEDCVRLIRVDRRSSPESPYEKVREWRVFEDNGAKYLYILSSPSPGETIRLHYIPEPTFFFDDTDTMDMVRLPERAKWAIIYLTCFYLCEEKLLPRARTNQFKNAEGVNVPKAYEVQRIAADFRTLADIELRRMRLGPKRFS